MAYERNYVCQECGTAAVLQQFGRWSCQRCGSRRLAIKPSPARSTAKPVSAEETNAAFEALVSAEFQDETGQMVHQFSNEEVAYFRFLESLFAVP